MLRSLNKTNNKKQSSFFRGFRGLLVVVGLFWGIKGVGQIVPVYADQVTLQSHVTNPSNATNSNLNDYATLESYGGIAIGIGSYTGELELKFPTALAAETTSYVKIDFDPALLDALLGGELGDGLAGLLGSVVLGDHFFNVEARLGGVTVLSGSSKDEFDSDRLRLIVNSAGDYLLAITPDKAYDRIYIEDQTNALLLGTTNSMDVYYAYYNTGQDPCEAAFATSFDGSGGTVDALDLGKNGVNNPENAIDGDDTTFSEMSLGLLTVGGELSQTIYFQSLSNANDEYHLSIKLADDLLLNLGLLNEISIEALNGKTVVSSKTLSSLLDLNLLNLLSTGATGDISFSPGVPFDRIRIVISSTLQVNLTKTVNIYEVYRSPAPPTNPAGAGNGEICFDTLMPAILSATTTSDNELVWYADEFGGTALDTTAYNGTYTTDPLSGPTTFYVAAKRIACPWESSRIPIEVIELPDIGAPTITIDDVVD